MAMRNVDQTNGINAQQLQRFLKPAGKPAGGTGSAESRAAANGGQAAGAAAPPAQDTVTLSKEAQRLESLQQTLEAGRQALAAVPDVRQERIAEAKAKLAAGEYSKPEVRRSTAARLGAVLRQLEDLTS